MIKLAGVARSTALRAARSAAATPLEDVAAAVGVSSRGLRRWLAAASRGRCAAEAAAARNVAGRISSRGAGSSRCQPRPQCARRCLVGAGLPYGGAGGRRRRLRVRRPSQRCFQRSLPACVAGSAAAGECFDLVAQRPAMRRQVAPPQRPRVIVGPHNRIRHPRRRLRRQHLFAGSSLRSALSFGTILGSSRTPPSRGGRRARRTPTSASRSSGSWRSRTHWTADQSR